MQSIVALGEIVVEIMAEAPGHGFREQLRLIGPFPSGAPAIFIDQVAKLGHPAGLISSVGDDDFGWLNLERLRADGVDTSAVRICPEFITGSAFVRYRPDGERDFVFNIKNSACAHTRITDDGRTMLESCRHLHIMGSSLFSEALIDETKLALKIVKSHGGTVSFDPNIRKEIVTNRSMRAALEMMLRRCDIFMPSGDELTLLTKNQTKQAAIDEILALGVTAVVVKRGAAGASYHDHDQTVSVPAFTTYEIDPTGAGDCFGATFITCRLQGRSVQDCLLYAAASGARAVTMRGPMEGTSSFVQLQALIDTAHGDHR